MQNIQFGSALAKCSYNVIVLPINLIILVTNPISPKQSLSNIGLSTQIGILYRFEKHNPRVKASYDKSRNQKMAQDECLFV